MRKALSARTRYRPDASLRARENERSALPPAPVTTHTIIITVVFVRVTERVPALLRVSRA
jgi:hypothetical protein